MNYFKQITASIIFFCFFLCIGCVSTQNEYQAGNPSAAGTSEYRPGNETVSVNSFITSSGNPAIAIYKYKIARGNTDEWAQVVFFGFEAASRIAENGSLLAVGILYSDGTSEGYFVPYSDYLDFKKNIISSEEFVNRIKVKELEN